MYDYKEFFILTYAYTACMKNVIFNAPQYLELEVIYIIGKIIEINIKLRF